MTRTDEITNLLQAWSRGDSEALEKLLPLVDHELKRIAHAYMLNERAARSLHTSALVQEALASLIVDKPIEWKSRKQFYAIIAWRMRNILVEHARKRKAEKRGKGVEHLNVDDVSLLSKEMSELLDLLDEALKKLARFDEQKAQIVQLRYFGGFTLEEVASIMELSQTKVEREWRLTRAWLYREITGEEE
jgi:RNA polymerase sigma factor (TIGR02999 family)